MHFRGRIAQHVYVEHPQHARGQFLVQLRMREAQIARRPSARHRRPAARAGFRSCVCGPAPSAALPSSMMVSSSRPLSGVRAKPASVRRNAARQSSSRLRIVFMSLATPQTGTNGPLLYAVRAAPKRARRASCRTPSRCNASNAHECASLQRAFEQFVDAPVLVVPAVRLREAVALQRIRGQLPLVLAQLDQACASITESL